MAILHRARVVLALVAACGFPHPDDVIGPGDDAPGDGALQPGLTIHVSTTGDDANDGLTRPVKTLKHALGLAAADSQIKNVALAPGRYASENGETFPYGVPAALAVVGPAGGGAILAGTGTEPGLMIDAGKLQDLELEDFAVAIAATGTASVANVRIRTSTVALRAETAAVLTVDNLDITGALGACNTGIVLNGAAALTAATLATRNLGTTVEARDQSTVSLSNANVTGDDDCTPAVVLANSNHSIVIRDSLFDGGSRGISLFPQMSGSQASITNTVLRNFHIDAIEGGFNSGGAVSLAMAGGEISGGMSAGGQLGAGTWTFQNVAFTQNRGVAFYLQDGSLVMRGCSITGNGSGIGLQSPASVDLGTVARPGNNIFHDNGNSALNCGGCQIQIEAVGNTWSPGIQGADSAGKYPIPAVVQGPITFVTGSNYALSCDPGQCALDR